jgi:hypothetical protein
MQKIKGRGSRKRRGEDGERSPQFPALARLENAAPTGRAHSPSSPRAPWRGRPPSPVPWVRPGCYTSVLHRDTARVPLPPRLPHGQPGSAVERDSAAAAAGDGHARPRRRAAGGLARRGDTPVPLLPPRLSTCCSGFFPSICCRAPRRRSPGGAEGSPTAHPRSHRSASAALAPSVRHQSRSLSRWGRFLRPQPGTNRPPRGQIWGLFFFPSTRNPRSATKHTHARLRSCCCRRLPCTSGGSSASPTQHARWAATTAPDPPTHNRVAGFAASPPPRVVSPRDSGILQEATASRSPRISLLSASLQSAECLRLPQG